MIDEKKVKQYLIDICNLSEQEIEKYWMLIAPQLVSIVDCVADEKYLSDERVIALVGANANYSIALSKACEDTVESFSAGEISIKENNKYLDNAKKLLEVAKNNCSSLLKDDSFAFLGV